MPFQCKQGTAKRAVCGLVLLGTAARLVCQCAFALPQQTAADAALGNSLRGAIGGPRGQLPNYTDVIPCGLAVATTAVVATVALGSARRRSQGAVASVTPMRYTTQEILPSLAWLSAGCSSKELNDGQLVVNCIAGVDIVVGKTASGKVFACADKCPPTGTSLSVGGEVDGDCIVDPQYGTKFNVFTGVPESDWCPSPPLIGGVVGFLMGGPQCVQVFEVREAFFGGQVEVQIDVNTKRAYEAQYWKGLLDAQGQNDGTFY